MLVFAVAAIVLSVRAIFPQILLFQARATLAACESTECLHKGLSQAIESAGLESGFVLAQELYAERPSFRPHCNKFLIEVTNDYVARHPRTLPPLTAQSATCNYAFITEYSRVLVVRDGSPEQALTFCDYVHARLAVDVPGAKAECYRGIGRGLPFTPLASTSDEEARAATAVAECRRITPDPNLYRTCLSGVFNSIARSASDGDAGLSITASDPMHLCKVQTDAEVRSRCFGNYKATVISLLDPQQTRDAQKEILALYGQSGASEVGTALWTLGYEWARAKLIADNSTADALAACSELAPRYTHLCIQGMSVGLAKHGLPFAQHRLLIDFCVAARTALPTLSSDDCPSKQAVGYLRGFYSPAAFAAAYADMEQALGTIVKLEPTEEYGY